MLYHSNPKECLLPIDVLHIIIFHIAPVLRKDYLCLIFHRVEKPWDIYKNKWYLN